MSTTNLPELKLEDLKIGMIVNTWQLDKIYDTYIWLEDTELTLEGTIGRIVYFSDKQSKEMKDAVERSRNKYGKRPFLFISSSAFAYGDCEEVVYEIK